jgi:hypothetical protein
MIHGRNVLGGEIFVHAPDGLLHAGNGIERVRLGAHHKDEVVRSGRVRLIRIAPGSAAPTKTPIACCGKTSPREPIFPAMRNPTWTKKPCA